MKRLDSIFSQAKKEQRAAFIAYLQAGDPNLEQSLNYASALIQAGVDIIEWGIPFSDPIADGPTNQAAAERSLAAGTTLETALAGAARLRKLHPQIPLIIFSYLNPLYRLGYEKFGQIATEAGIDGVLIVDLPPDEDLHFIKMMQRYELATCFLAAPTTPTTRLDTVNTASSGFVYYVSRTGVTGKQRNFAANVQEDLARVKAHIQRPLVVGFGISSADQVATIAQLTDGVVIGSAIVEQIAASGNNPNGPKLLQEFITPLVKACRKS